MVWPYVFLDDTYCKGPGQPPGGVLGGGDRDRGDRRWAPGGAGFEVGDSEDAALWTAFLGSLRPAGLGGAAGHLDVPTGLRQAIGTVMLGASW
jgi:hypothetical protein